MVGKILNKKQLVFIIILVSVIAFSCKNTEIPTAVSGTLINETITPTVTVTATITPTVTMTVTP